MENTSLSFVETFNSDYLLKVEHKKNNLFSELNNKQTSIAVVGLGYVGLPLALHMASEFSVIGFDLNTSKIQNLKNHIDPCDESKKEDFINKDIRFYDESSELKNAKFYIVAVPTPVDMFFKPDLSPVISATKLVAQNLKEGDIVVFESTVYPGCTEEICIPILENISGLVFNEDFFVGYSPERINPGDTENTFATIKKIVSGSTPEALDIIAKVYGKVVKAGIHKASSLKVAEAAKVVENTQRDINIALMNELSFIFDKVGISTQDVLEAAGTKWNFLNFFPGLVGGHCIGVDPYYLIHKARQLDIEPHFISSARNVNEKMIDFLVDKVNRNCTRFNLPNNEISILIKGITFKENVKDVRNSKIAEIAERLNHLDYNLIIEDPFAEAEDVSKHYNLTLVPQEKINQKFDIVIMAVNHDSYQDIKELDSLLTFNGFVLDIKGAFRNKVTKHSYFTI